MTVSATYEKTAKGIAVLQATRGPLPALARRLLILMDGKRNVDELTALLGAEGVEPFLATLESDGYIFREMTEAASGQSAGDLQVRELVQIPSAGHRTVRTGGLARLGVWLLVPLGAAIAFAWWTTRASSDSTVAEHKLANAASTVAVQDVGAKAVSDTENAGPTPVGSPLPTSAVVSDLGSKGDIRSVQVPADLPSLSRAQRPENTALVATGKELKGDPPRRGAVNAVDKLSGHDVAAPSNRPPASGDGAAKVEPRIESRPTQAPATAAAISQAQTQTMEQPAAREVQSTDSSSAPASPPAARATDTTASAHAGLQPATPVAGAGGFETAKLHIRGMVDPKLPKSAAMAGIDTGRFTARLQINALGIVEHVDLVSAEPPEVFDHSVERTLMRWTFDPPGRTVRQVVSVRFER